MTEPTWILVRIMGGEVNGFEYETLIEPEHELVFMKTPWRDFGWVRIPRDAIVPDADVEYRHYRREPSVEQFDHERIYYPEGLT